MAAVRHEAMEQSKGIPDPASLSSIAVSDISTSVIVVRVNLAGFAVSALMHTHVSPIYDSGSGCVETWGVIGRSHTLAN